VACTEKFIASFAHTWTLRLWTGLEPDDVYTDVLVKVDYYLVMDEGRSIHSACALRVSPIILAIVTILTSFKCVCIAWTAYLYRRDCRTPYSSPKSARTNKLSNRASLHLVTVGDVIASFLEEEDNFTKGLDGAMKAMFLGRWPVGRSDGSLPKPEPSHWFRAASKWRWFITMAL
jgi:hypothetical protein